MENALLVGLSRQVALSRELEVIANNMANVGTNGFKARSARFNEFVMPKAKAEAFKPADRALSYVIDKGTPLDLSQGTIEFTGNPLDVALKDDNFLVVQTPAGERYTRAGSLTVNRQGQLVTQLGQPVMGQGGPINFGPSEYDLRIAADGTVTSDQGTRGRLRQVRFADPTTLVSEGNNLVSSTAAPQPPLPGSKFETGALERSNVKAVSELTRLMEVQRAYQDVASMITRNDDLRSKAISRLADQQA
ncbi:MULTISPECIES: flagellar basal-body rod protein FlgF [unclassified Bosea (in: a-proteobacteria)]|uniref:flagellar basal-body rod protein FlgF n=1 Tax=unclassified Bosea (in: a-proteobacteria) TaxID=2653178 RepID=UPI000956667E|nr:MULTISPECIES: flagellar basal-body rod protein FlgF [unclassified Bosea (in: a-proteobacteria)]TAJ28843.1 MAG: flagellar basal-body rod protein FlgF [Bosea sp. (in: a-proteobacteria)]SIQ21559.1 flagellar basal-body rod protein FlgF [Bosea sp. TND4EK4]